MSPKPRDSLLIIRDILAVAAKRASKTEIVYRSNINFVAAEKYITRLLLRGMLVTVVDEGKSKFQTTPLGIGLSTAFPEWKSSQWPFVKTS